jgi:predicted RNA-binding Zn-ribbon protein involved in translation (DUF1610 family)
MQWNDALTVAAPCALLGGLLLIILRKSIARWLNPPVEAPPIPCPKCGYDIRATLFQCPECGQELLWGALPGKQREYDEKARKYERQFQS